MFEPGTCPLQLQQTLAFPAKIFTKLAKSAMLRRMPG